MSTASTMPVSPYRRPAACPTSASRAVFDGFSGSSARHLGRVLALSDVTDHACSDAVIVRVGPSHQARWSTCRRVWSFPPAQRWYPPQACFAERKSKSPDCGHPRHRPRVALSRSRLVERPWNGRHRIPARRFKRSASLSSLSGPRRGYGSTSRRRSDASRATSPEARRLGLRCRDPSLTFSWGTSPGEWRLLEIQNRSRSHQAFARLATDLRPTPPSVFERSS